MPPGVPDPTASTAVISGFQIFLFAAIVAAGLAYCWLTRHDHKRDAEDKSHGDW